MAKKVKKDYVLEIERDQIKTRLSVEEMRQKISKAKK